MSVAWDPHKQHRFIIMNEPKDKSLDRSCTESAGNGSFLSTQYESLDQSLDSSTYHLPVFEFSSPISSIADVSSADNTPEKEMTLQPRLPLDDETNNDSFMSIEDIQSLISPPYDTTPKCDGLETIFEHCYLETGPGTPTTPRTNRLRRVRINLNNFDEFKENVQNNHKLPDEQMSPSSTDSIQDFPRLLIREVNKSVENL